jgi:hypothetical protein
VCAMAIDRATNNTATSNKDAENAHPGRHVRTITVGGPHLFWQKAREAHQKTCPRAARTAKAHIQPPETGTREACLCGRRRTHRPNLPTHEAQWTNVCTAHTYAFLPSLTPVILPAISGKPRVPPGPHTHLRGWRSPCKPPPNSASPDLQQRDRGRTDTLSSEPQHHLRKLRSHRGGGCWRWMFSVARSRLSSGSSRGLIKTLVFGHGREGTLWAWLDPLPAGRAKRQALTQG